MLLVHDEGDVETRKTENIRKIEIYILLTGLVAIPGVLIAPAILLDSNEYSFCKIPIKRQIPHPFLSMQNFHWLYCCIHLRAARSHRIQESDRAVSQIHNPHDGISHMADYLHSLWSKFD